MSRIRRHFSLRSTIVKTLIVDGKTIYRHYFEWYDRDRFDLCYLHLVLIRQNGTTIGQELIIKFPKSGIIQMDKRGRTIKIMHYDVSPFFYVDADEIAPGYDFYTATLTERSDWQLNTISKKRKDLRSADQKKNN